MASFTELGVDKSYIIALKELGINKLCIFKQRKKEYVDI